MKIRILIGLLMVVVLAGCSEKALLNQLAPKQDVQFAKNYLALFPAGNFKSIEAKLSPDLQAPQVDARLRKMAAFFPRGKPLSVQLVGAQTYLNGNTGVSHVRLSFEYQYPGKWLVADVVLRKQDKKTVVVSAGVVPIPDSLEHTNRFTFAGKGIVQYAILVASIAAFLLTLTALILCIRTRIPKRKWLWILFILFGFTNVIVNWTTGQVTFKLLYLSLLSAGAVSAGPYAPWLITVSFPLGAIIFLLRRKRWLEQTSGPVVSG